MSVKRFIIFIIPRLVEGARRRRETKQRIPEKFTRVAYVRDESSRRARDLERNDIGRIV